MRQNVQYLLRNLLLQVFRDASDGTQTVVSRPKEATISFSFLGIPAIIMSPTNMMTRLMDEAMDVSDGWVLSVCFGQRTKGSPCRKRTRRLTLFLEHEANQGRVENLDESTSKDSGTVTKSHKLSRHCRVSTSQNKKNGV